MGSLLANLAQDAGSNDRVGVSRATTNMTHLPSQDKLKDARAALGNKKAPGRKASGYEKKESVCRVSTSYL